MVAERQICLGEAVPRPYTPRVILHDGFRDQNLDRTMRLFSRLLPSYSRMQIGTVHMASTHNGVSSSYGGCFSVTKPSGVSDVAFLAELGLVRPDGTPFQSSGGV